MADNTSAVKECLVTMRGHSTVLDTDPRATGTLTVGPRALCSLATVSKSLLLASLLSLTSGCWWDFSTGPFVCLLTLCGHLNQT